jgi:hypothetical protein
MHMQVQRLSRFMHMHMHNHNLDSLDGVDLLVMYIQKVFEGDKQARGACSSRLY